MKIEIHGCKDCLFREWRGGLVYHCLYPCEVRFIDLPKAGVLERCPLKQGPVTYVLEGYDNED